MTHASPGDVPGSGAVARPLDGDIRLIVVDDHPVVCSGIVQLLEHESGIDVVGQARDGQQAVELAGALRPDVVLMDLRMPAMGGVEATRLLRTLPEPPQVVILTTYETDAEIVRAVEAGAIGYILKGSSPEQIAGAVRAAAVGQAVMSQEVTTRFMQAACRSATMANELSSREREVLTVIAQGLSNAQAAQRLFVSEATIKTHLRRVYAKLAVDCRTAAVTEAVRRGLVEI